ncbi:hypothetical protein L1049_026401 [Liquidambar formosana]|uniref:Major facilitator superfamily (MFS) profile domain-containing protein n=1 Tax=Liquidambar formosana TaxID=63359 RepID=A0AAP0NFG9_LIQFO
MEKLSGLSHLFMTVFLYCFSAFMVSPAITDVTMSALCPGEDECSLAIYLSGFQQAIIGLGTLVMMPLVGNLSDKYGRKTLLTIPMSLTVIPLGREISSTCTTCSRRSLAWFVKEAVNCIAHAYVADNIPEIRRASAFGILSGIGSAAFVAASVAAVATLYMKVFLPDSIIDDDISNQTKSKAKPEIKRVDGDPKRNLFKTLPSLDDIISLLRSSSTFSQAAIVAFFSHLGDVGLHASLMYYLKARFHFNKDQFADLMAISGIAGTISQLLLMPILATTIGEEKLLSIGLFFSCTTVVLYSIAWSYWVPYAAAMFSVLIVFAQPCIRSIASKQVGHSEQGKAQGCISGLCSLANVVSPLAFTPLTALFLSERAPFYFPGFSILCVGFASLIAFLQSIMIRAAPPILSQRVSNCYYVEA